MKIETLDALLKEKNCSGAFARIPSKNGRRANNKVEVAFSASGRVYTYIGSIFDVAERLELVPEIIVGDEAQRIVDNFTNGIKGYAVAYDTVRHLLEVPSGHYVDYEVVGQDEFDRDIARFFVAKDTEGWV